MKSKRIPKESGVQHPSPFPLCHRPDEGQPTGVSAGALAAGPLITVPVPQLGPIVGILMLTNHIFLPHSDHCCSPKRRRGHHNQGFPRRPARQDTSDQPDPTVSFPPAGSLLTTLRRPTIPTSSTNMPIRSTQRAAIPIPVKAREEPFEAADEPVALPVLPVLLPLVTGADVDVVVARASSRNRRGSSGSRRGRRGSRRGRRGRGGTA